MPDKFKIATAILGLIVIYDTRVDLRNKAKFERIAQENLLLREVLEESFTRTVYLASMIDKHEIKLDAFDAIAISNPM